MHVLYLDYDGVLHPDDVYRHPKLGIYLDQLRAPGRRLFEFSEHLIHALAPYPQVRIVLSTSWVRDLGYSRARAFLPPELSVRVIGATYHRRFHRGDDVLGFPSFRPDRGVEVMRDVFRRQPYEWVAVDDNHDGWPQAHRDRVVLCKSGTGLGAESAQTLLKEVLVRYFSSCTS